MRYLVSVALLLTVCGCTSGFPIALFPAPDQQLFLQGMEEWKAGEKIPAAFGALEKSYPESPWTQKSRMISELATTIIEQQIAIRRLEGDLNSCRQENTNLRQQKKSLENDQEKLKRLLIDLERR